MAGLPKFVDLLPLQIYFDFIPHSYWTTSSQLPDISIFFSFSSDGLEIQHLNNFSSNTRLSDL